ncbi:Short-chain dehydrogenase/reductase SDR [Penicillium hispanicum]|uniref:Short-chain dehydrogenase/reductase SDR n=1 Tax=Penicillium hispanicum TaxID=1080232 RepID=UPI0025416B9E|nr:Short-chain dehydrogenase/reductase SDR [Penicillium hispanicum]KAJ5584311.1 Short-chain dehydrogenase/reductase SDR [Penicillium hispanicum]
MAGQLTWLVTGCSSGMGESLVHAILAAVSILPNRRYLLPSTKLISRLQGDRVIATARARDKSGLERLAPLKDAGAALMELDVTAPEEMIHDKVKEAWSIYGQVDVLVNNAGYIEASIFEETDEALLTAALRNNAIGPLNLTRAFLPYMRSRRSGTLLFMSTLGVYYGAPGAGPYTSAKGLLENLVSCLQHEVEPFGLRTCMLTAGYFRTNVMTPGNVQFRAPRPVPEYAEMNKQVQAHVNAADQSQPGDPRKAADVIVEAVRGEGRCAGKVLPARLPLGADAVKAMRGNAEANSKICAEWEDIASSTNL